MFVNSWVVFIRLLVFYMTIQGLSLMKSFIVKERYLSPRIGRRTDSHGGNVHWVIDKTRKAL